MTLVCAHRGASLQLPDNSLAAFTAAIATGADLIETDVRRAPDGRLVLAHDTWDVVEDAVTLQALLELADGRIGLDLEIVEPGVERAVLDAVDGFAGPLILTSCLPPVLASLARSAPDLSTGLVIEAAYDGYPLQGHPLAADPFALAASCSAATVLVEDELATEDLLAAAAGRPLWVWTVNDEARLRELLVHPAVTGVITDDPALAVALADSAAVR